LFILLSCLVFFKGLKHYAVKGNVSASTQNRALDHTDLALVQGDEQRNSLTCIWLFYTLIDQKQNEKHGLYLIKATNYEKKKL